MDLKYLLDRIATVAGYCKNAIFQKGNQPAIVESALNISLAANNRNAIPSCRPPGFISLPNDNTYQIVMNLGVGRNYPIVINHLPAIDPTSLLDIQTGECAIYSNNYITEMKNSKVEYKWTNPQGQFSGTALTAENFNLVATDIMNALNDIKTYLNAIQNIYDNHIHPIPSLPDTLAPTQPFSTYTQRPEINEDLTAIANGKTLISDTGISPIRGS